MKLSENRPRQKRRAPGELSPPEQALLLELLRAQMAPPPTGFPGDAQVRREPASSQRALLLKALYDRVSRSVRIESAAPQRIVKAGRRRKPGAA